MTMIRAISKEAAIQQARRFTLADYGYICDSEKFRWFVIIYVE